MLIRGTEVRGVEADAETRCAHYHGPLDVVAIKFRCCLMVYACHRCHEELTDHPSLVWPRRAFHAKAVLCGACGGEMEVHAYLAADDRCPACGHRFNPGCRAHHHLYFEASGMDIQKLPPETSL